MKKFNKIASKYANFLRFFEFSAMIVAALKHMGHTSLNFLMSLGITALLRNLITAHGEPMQILIHSIAILLLIIGIVILNRHIKL